MNGVTVLAQRPLEFANEADAVLFGSGIYHRAIADPKTERGAWLDRLHLDPLRQTIGAQCSGTLLLARLGLLGDMPACADATTGRGSCRPACGWSTSRSMRAARSQPPAAAWRRCTSRRG